MTAAAPHHSRSSRVHGFVTTHWSLVLAARDPASQKSITVLAALCEAYWYPLYAFVRRLGHTPEDAQDLTQEFFARLLKKDCLADVVRDKGRFRSFLLASLKHFLANEQDKARAQKRGGGRSFSQLGDKTVGSEAEIEDEIWHLFSALSGPAR